MITPEQIDILLDVQVRKAITENISRAPVDIALDRNIPCQALVASQVKYLQRARTKLPSYYAARCIIPGRAFEQSSGEQVAAARGYSGDLCIDLTCGLGVESFHLSRSFERVVSVEKDPALARVAEINFARLGAPNITVVNSSAERFLADNPQIKADMIYTDPDRRDGEGRKMVTLEDCSPDIKGLLPHLRRIAPKIVVKLSPMFDIAEAFRIFGPHARVTVISLGGECKEVSVEIDESFDAPVIRAEAIGLGRAEYPYESGSRSAGALAGRMSPEDFGYLVVPDVALAKSRLAARYFTERGAYIGSDSSFAFFRDPPQNVLGKCYSMESVAAYSPKKLKKELKRRGIGQINILRRDFPYSAAETARRLGIGEGGDIFAAFTRMEGRLWAIFLNRV